MMCGRRLSAISLCLAVTFAPLFNAQADEPEVIPGDNPGVSILVLKELY